MKGQNNDNVLKDLNLRMTNCLCNFNKTQKFIHTCRVLDKELKFVKWYMISTFPFSGINLFYLDYLDN